MKKLLLTILLLLSACNFPILREQTATPAPTVAPVSTLVPNIPLQPTPQPGTDANPLILALTPSAHPSADVVSAGQLLAAQLQALTGYTIVTVAPASEVDLVQAFSLGNAHIGALSPFGYALAYENGNINAALASARNGQVLYGAQFIARADQGFKSYFDPARNENTADMFKALSQFNDKKPCWSDMASPSGYVVPLGFLNQAGVQVSTPAFVEGQAPVVRAVYGKGICDFGATYIDARALPALESDYPDVMEKVTVIWRIPPIIPYEQIVFASSLTPEMKSTLLRAFIDFAGTPEGKAAVQKVYGLDVLQPAEDRQYKDFITYVDKSGIDLHALLK